ncbi:MAG TPA: RES family NAD+ phosphorylase [Acidobacteriaceae bacterium]|nr:RES family NAD+ phosphorylase [Acidobacteriaceae bacterium]
MLLWRISRHFDLRGLGGLKVPGRWHYAGQPVVYLAGNPASALLEVCVHTSANDVPPEFQLLKIEAPDGAVSEIDPNDLPGNWRSDLESTRNVGTAWLQKSEAVLLRVPSALVPETANFLFNPSHPDAAKFHVAGIYAYPFDRRLKH